VRPVPFRFDLLRNNLFNLIRIKNTSLVIPMFRCPVSMMLILILASAASGSIIVVDDDGAGNFTKIQDAINASEIGDEIVVKNGTYPENVVVDRSIVLKGENGPVVDGCDLSSPPIRIAADGVVLDGFTVYGCIDEGLDTSAVLVESDECKILNNTIRSSSGYGLSLLNSDNNIVSGNIARDNGHCGICLIGSNFSQLLGNEAFGNRKCGITLFGCDYVALTANRVYENGEVGINVVNSTTGEIRLNEIRFNEEDGIFLKNSMNNALIDNEIRENKHNGINLYHSTANFVIGNEVQGSGEEGILIVERADDNLISSNLISENGINGIGIYGSYSSTIINNRVSFNEDNGIYSRDYSGGTMVANNDVYGNFRYGIGLEDSGSNFIKANRVHDNLNGIIMVRCENIHVTLNEISQNYYGLSLEFVRSFVISENEIYNNSNDGFQMKRCDESRIWENDILENGNDGIHISESLHTVIFGNTILNNSDYGVQVLDWSSLNTFMYNNVRNNVGGGFYFYEGDINLITGNIIAENQRFNVRDNMVGNKWLGNFYGDYSGEDLNGDSFGDEPYAIYGRRGAESFDPRPIISTATLEEISPAELEGTSWV